MNGAKRDILVVVRNQFVSDDAIEHELECLNAILRKTETSDNFCTAHELVNRNRITRKRYRILRESRYFRLRPFRFLINKN